ncbi:hypothetical protein LCGC14_2465840 [marine sediment metagenome]|uniref:FAD-binding domain-containing protein n=1 Tax=marine sediment metagenome TaxID=412755 RepID=A0A0F9BBV9_9ZZZZ
MYDIAIIGAGPAGATLAREIGTDCRTLLVDRRELREAPAPGARDKCCGGLLAPDAQRMLARFGLAMPADILADPQLFSVRVIDLPSGRQRDYQRHYVNIDRGRFDRWLVSLVPQEVDVRFGWRFRACRRVGRVFALTLTRGGRCVTVRARTVVGADGASSPVRACSPPGGPHPRAYIAVQHWYRPLAAPPHFCAVFDPRITDYYCWTIPKRDALILGAALKPSRHALKSFGRLKRSLEDVGFRFGVRIRAEAAMLLRPTHPGQLRLGRDGIVLVGEAAGFVSPSSGEGLSYAMANAAILAEAIRPDAPDLHRRYRAMTRSLRANIAAKWIKARLMYSPLARGVLLASGLRSLATADPAHRPPVALKAHA